MGPTRDPCRAVRHRAARGGAARHRPASRRVPGRDPTAPVGLARAGPATDGAASRAHRRARPPRGVATADRRGLRRHRAPVRSVRRPPARERLAGRRPLGAPRPVLADGRHRARPDLRSRPRLVAVHRPVPARRRERRAADPGARARPDERRLRRGGDARRRSHRPSRGRAPRRSRRPAPARDRGDAVARPLRPLLQPERPRHGGHGHRRGGAPPVRGRARGDVGGAGDRPPRAGVRAARPGDTHRRPRRRGVLRGSPRGERGRADGLPGARRDPEPERGRSPVRGQQHRDDPAGISTWTRGRSSRTRATRASPAPT